MTVFRPAYLMAFLLLFPQVASAQNPPGAAVFLNSVTLDDDTLRVHFIDIGGGLGVLIETPSGKHILIDGGKRGSAPAADLTGVGHPASRRHEAGRRLGPRSIALR